MFKYGLKDGLWKYWHKNGKLKLLEYWNNGFRDGTFITYDSKGDIIQKGHYRNNLKEGCWINNDTKDTLYYKKNVVLGDKPKNIFERIFVKRDSTEKAIIKLERNLKKRQDSLDKVKHKAMRRLEKSKDSILKINKGRTKSQQGSITRKGNNKGGFFKQLFRKK